MTDETMPAVERSQNFRAIYVNHARGGATNWELQITFSVLSDRLTKPVIEEQLTLLMTPEFAKAVIGTLTEAINGYNARPGGPAATQSG